VFRVVTALNHLGDFLSKHRELAMALGVVFGTVLAAGLVAATVAMIQFSIALLNNPIFLIVAAIALLALGIFELVRQWSTVWAGITGITATAWHAISGFAGRMWRTWPASPPGSGRT
jgi:hypothetical protein